MKIEYENGWSITHNGEEISGVQYLVITNDAGESRHPEVEIGVFSMECLKLDVDPEMVRFVEDKRFHGSIASVCDGCTGIVAQDIGITEDGECTECGESLVSEDFDVVEF